jgi:N-acetylglucosamine kinase-like BadF-type ATPase
MVLEAAVLSPADLRLAFVAHGAAATNRSAEKFAVLLTDILSGLGARSELIVTSDMVPVIASAPGQAAVAGIFGTGTVFAAHREFRFWARSSGADYLLSDEGGGFDLGMHGLRAAIRASDGRGPTTDLADRAFRWVGQPDEAILSEVLYDRVYVARPRPVVAQFARQVLASAAGGDEVAVALVDHAADEFLVGVRAVAEGVNISHGSPQMILSGSLATVDSPLRTAILERLTCHFSPSTITNYDPTDMAMKAENIVRLIQTGGHGLEGLRRVLPVSVARIN